MQPSNLIAAGIVDSVRSALVRRDLSAARRLERDFRAKNGGTPEALAALSWVARGELNFGRADEAVEHARQARRLAARLAKRLDLKSEPYLATALGASIEVLAQAMERGGRRSEAARFLKAEFMKFGDTPINTRIRKNLNLLTLEGQPAPELEIPQWLGSRPPSPAKLRGRPVLLFFWAHYCDDSRAEGRVLARLRKRFAADLAILRPTRLYGHLDEEGYEPAGPAREKRHIKAVLDRYYPELSDMPVILGERNFVTYGASTTPTLVLVDRDGRVDLYHPGKLPYGELAARVKAAAAK